MNSRSVHEAVSACQRALDLDGYEEWEARTNRERDEA